MYKIYSAIFIVFLVILIVNFGWISLLWFPLGYVLGLFISANMLLPIIMGIPLAAYYVFKKQMRPMVFLSLLRAPIIWFVALFILGYFFSSGAEWILQNRTLNIGLNLGFFSILLTPISKKGRSDFKDDFDKAWGKYYTDQHNFELNYTEKADKNQLKQIEEIIKISSNLYLHTFSNSEDALKFKFPDSRYRCMIFCLSTVVKCCEDLFSSPESLQKECIHFLSNILTSKDEFQKYFGQKTLSKDAETIGNVYFDAFMDKWTSYYDEIKNDDKKMATEILYNMIHAIETNEPLTDSDRLRLNPICWDIEFSLTHESMRSAFITLMAK